MHISSQKKSISGAVNFSACDKIKEAKTESYSVAEKVLHLQSCHFTSGGTKGDGRGASQLAIYFVSIGY